MIRATIRVPRNTVVLVLDDDPDRREWFAAHLCEQSNQVRFCVIDADVGRALRFLRTGRPKLLFLDHDLMHEGHSLTVKPDAERTNTGTSFAFQAWRRNLLSRDATVVIHSWNPGGAAQMAGYLAADAAQVYMLPFGSFEIEVVE